MFIDDRPFPRRTRERWTHARLGKKPLASRWRRKGAPTGRLDSQVLALSISTSAPSRTYSPEPSRRAPDRAPGPLSARYAATSRSGRNPSGAVTTGRRRAKCSASERGSGQSSENPSRRSARCCAVGVDRIRARRAVHRTRRVEETPATNPRHARSPGPRATLRRRLARNLGPIHFGRRGATTRGRASASRARRSSWRGARLEWRRPTAGYRVCRRRHKTRTLPTARRQADQRNPPGAAVDAGVGNVALVGNTEQRPSAQC